MNTLPGNPFRKVALPFAASVALVALSFFAGVGQLPAAPMASTSPVTMTMESSGTIALLQVPANCTSVTIDRRPTGSSAKWTRFKAVPVKSAPASLKITLPKNFAKFEWRATGSFPATSPTAHKYPASFYRGVHSFAATVASSYGSQTAGGAATADRSGNAVAMDSMAAAAPSATTASPTVEESDIWKADGTTIYFFNQLRGLQVIDLSDPANPTLRASLRLPASGQDLYVVPGDGSVRYAVLLTQTYDQKTYQPLTGVKVVSVDGSTASLVSETTINGYMADSRLHGNRLYLATQQWAWNSGSSTDTTTLNELVIDSSGTVTAGTSHAVSGSWPVISAGNDWLAVAAQDPTDWQTSRITLFQLSNAGATTLTASPVTAFGRVYDKYNVQYASGTLTVISQKWVSTGGSWWNNTPVTELQNFAVTGDVLGSLEIIRGESLHATRFAGNKAYIVTFQQIDPLWVVDLSDPKNPVVAGQVEVPGWSTHIEPVGDLLFTIGFDSGKVAASLFDVSDPANPALLKRVKMDGTWGFSEATYDEKALKVLPDDGLVLVPYSSYASDGTTSRYVQLLDLDIAGRDLRLRGQITHNFQPRRATVLAGSLASISQRELVTANIADRDNPAILADLLLAWPVNRLVSSGDYLIEIAEGGSWTGEPPVARVALTSDPDSVLEEVDLGAGTVRDAVLQGGKLYVLRQTPANQNFRYYYGGPIIAMRMVAGTDAVQALSGNSTQADQPAVYLDIYDASALPKLSLLGSVSSPLTGGQTYDIGSLLWASPACPVVVVQPQSWSYFNYPMLLDAVPVAAKATVASSASVAASGVASSMMIWRPPTLTSVPAVAIIFQVADASAPTVQSPLTLTAAGDSAVNAPTAGGGLLVFGYGSKEAVLAGGTFSRCQHSLRILDLQNPSIPALRSPIALPGRLVAATDVTHDGFLAWTESFGSKKIQPVGDRQLQVSTCDGAQVFQVASLSLNNFGALTADGRSLFVTKDKAVNRYDLNDAGTLAAGGSIPLDWTPNALRAIAGGLLGNDWNHLFRSTSTTGEVSDWQGVDWADVQKVVPLEYGSVLVPAGEYGVDRLDP